MKKKNRENKSFIVLRFNTDCISKFLKNDKNLKLKIREYTRGVLNYIDNELFNQKINSDKIAALVDLLNEINGKYSECFHNYDLKINIEVPTELKERVNQILDRLRETHFKNIVGSNTELLRLFVIAHIIGDIGELMGYSKELQNDESGEHKQHNKLFEELGAIIKENLEIQKNMLYKIIEELVSLENKISNNNSKQTQELIRLKSKMNDIGDVVNNKLFEKITKMEQQIDECLKYLKKQETRIHRTAAAHNNQQNKETEQFEQSPIDSDIESIRSRLIDLEYDVHDIKQFIEKILG